MCPCTSIKLLMHLQKKPKTPIFGTKSLKKVFQLGQFRSCRGKPPKPPRNKDVKGTRKSESPLVIGSPTTVSPHPNHRSQHGRHHQHHQHQNHRNRVATSGSDVSVVRHEHAFHGLNRNSSSGYVLNRFASFRTICCNIIFIFWVKKKVARNMHSTVVRKIISFQLRFLFRMQLRFGIMYLHISWSLLLHPTHRTTWITPEKWKAPFKTRK